MLTSFKLSPAHILFLSDNVKEVDAAVAAGMQSIMVDRPGNAPLSDADTNRLQVVNSLEQVDLTQPSESNKQSSLPDESGRRQSSRLKDRRTSASISAKSKID